MSGGVAIVGMACIFPGAKNLEAYWSNIVTGVDAIRDVPANRWDPIYYDPTSKAPDRFYCKRGGFIDDYAEFDALSFGVMPVEAHGAEPDQFLALQVASHALADAGYDSKPFAREKTGVILGRGNYMTPGLTRIDQHVRAAEQLAANLRACVPEIDEDVVHRVKTAFQEQLGTYSPEHAIGLVPNLAASRIANCLDLQGPAYTVDAACASALVAIDQACQQLNSAGCDLVLAGGVHLTHDVTFWSVFSQLGALSRRQEISPFSRNADGLLIGEGVGFIVLERLEDAVKHGRRVYAVIRGTGVASDGRATSLMNPRVEGQLLALKRAWTAARFDPETVGLIEAHGAGTPAGDATELTMLARFFGSASSDKPRAGLGSVKSMIGHTMPAAGIAGVIKAALAVHYGLLPPTLHCEEPHPGLEDTRFRLIDTAEPWERKGAHRIAGINAFGFGGINAHVVLKEQQQPLPTRRRSQAPDRIELALPQSPALLTFAARTPEELLSALNKTGSDSDGTCDEPGANDICRLAVFDPTPSRLDRVRQIVSRGKPWRGREDFWFVPKGLIGQGGKLAFLFPGVDSAFKPRVEDVARCLKLTPPKTRSADSLQRTSLAVLETNRVLYRAVLELGITADAMAGHGIGEWSALIAAGMVSEGQVDRFISGLLPDNLVVPDITFMDVGCNTARAAKEIADLDSIAISHDNGPNQVILCGKLDSIDKAARRLRSKDVVCNTLDFQSAFHSPLFAEHVGPFQEKLRGFEFGPAATPVWSATTCKRYPEDTRSIEELTIEHLVKPVRYRELIETLYKEGCRVFLQIGSGSLTNFVTDTLHGRAHVAMPVNVPARSGLDQLRRLAAALFVEGLTTVRLAEKPAGSKTPQQTIKLSLGVPFVKLDGFHEKTNGKARPVKTATSQEASSDSHKRQTSTIAPRRSETKWIVSVEKLPFLMDHCFFRQAATCSSLLERYPVVPMTTSLEMLAGAAMQLVPGRTVLSMKSVRSNRRLTAVEPVEATLTTDFDGIDNVRAAIDGYIDASLTIAPTFPSPPPPSLPPLIHARRTPIPAVQLYSDHWMSHGPSFQGIVDLGPIGINGIDGRIHARSAPGATLDNAGQLLSYWVMAATEVNRLAVPTSVDEIRFFTAAPAEGVSVECRVRIQFIHSTTVRADIELSYNDTLWCSIRGWEDRRFEIDEQLWPLVRLPERHVVSWLRPEGYALFRDIYSAANARDYLSRRFLCESERSNYLTVDSRNQRQWLAGRIAAKDAARAWLWGRGYGPLFPAEISISEKPGGRPVIAGPFREDLQVSIAHKDDIAVAVASEGKPTGIDIEKLDGFTPDHERRLKVLTAQNAVGKFLGHRPGSKSNAFEITDVTEDELCVNGIPVRTRRDGEYIVSWTA